MDALNSNHILAQSSTSKHVIEGVSNCIDEYSPALSAVLKRAPYLPHEIDLITSAFFVSAETDGFYERGIERKPDESFNPRPARIAKILIENFEKPTVEMVATLILSCCLKSPQRIDSHLEIAWERSRLVHKRIYSSSEYQGQDPLPQELHSLLLIQALDVTRHLHLSTYQDSTRRELIEYYQMLLGLCVRDSNLRIRELLQSAINRYIRSSNSIRS